MNDCSWKPTSNLKNSKRILAAFDNKHETELQLQLHQVQRLYLSDNRHL